MACDLRNCAAALLLIACAASAQTQASAQRSYTAGAAASSTRFEPIEIDARSSTQSPSSLSLLPMGTARNPGGHSITINSRYLMRDGAPWLPVMGEFHFSRYPHQYWEEELLKMKAAGIEIVASYVIWIHHEEVQGQFDWSGDRDLREFVRLCGKHGLLVVARIGPWTHAEVRNGGFPDWVQRMPNTRSNDPQYLTAVDTYYREIVRQLQGQLWKEGGPVIGVQLENEYGLQGPGKGAAHILKLKQLAVAAGLDVPLYTVTGWDGALFPAREVLPVFGGYADWPWDGSLEKLPPNELYAFRFENREGGDLGAAGGRPPSHATQAELAPYPFLGAEFGAGTEDTYHRRPVIHAADVAALLPTQLGAGLNLLGYYMFQGGANPSGKLTTLQESQATGYPNDLPEISYDFQAPLGEFGEERESYRKIKLFHYFLNEFGAQLAPMVVHAPNQVPTSPSDFSVPRLALRSLGEQAFLFLNNYVRGYPMPPRDNFQVRIRLPDEDVLVPKQPITVPNGAYFIWPVNLTIQGVKMRYATAQVITTLEREHESFVFMVAQDGIVPEFAVALRTGQSVESRLAEDTPRADDGEKIIRANPGAGIAFTVRSPTAKPTHFVVFTQEQAERLTLLEIGGRKTLLNSAACAFSDGEALHLRSADPNPFFGVLDTASRSWQSDTALGSQPADGVFQMYQASLPPRKIAVEVTPIKPAGLAPPVELGKIPSWRDRAVALAPSDSTMENFAARWSIKLSKENVAGAEDVFLQIHYEGDLGRLFADGNRIDDNFYDGEPWVVGLKRFSAHLETPLQLQILPLRDDAPVHFDSQYKPHFAGKQTAVLSSVSVVPEYEVILHPQNQK